MKDDISELFLSWFQNEDIQLCSDVIIENFSSPRIARNRRFTNSISAFEAYVKRFIHLDVKQTLENQLNLFQDYFEELGEIPKKDISRFIKNIVHARKDYIHFNLKTKKVFSDFELLYISYLLDFIISIEILKQIGANDKIIEKVKMRAKSTYIDSQAINRMLGDNIYFKR